MDYLDAAISLNTDHPIELRALALAGDNLKDSIIHCPQDTHSLRCDGASTPLRGATLRLLLIYKLESTTGSLITITAWRRLQYTARYESSVSMTFVIPVSRAGA